MIDDIEVFSPHSIVYGLKHGEFLAMDKALKKKLLKIMARISEKSYRRGLQHGSLSTMTVDPAYLRFNVSPDYSPFTDVVGKNGKWMNNKQSSLDRLLMEYGGLQDIGLSL
jgi:protein involved in sex pheromone biosynthesis